MGRSGDRFLNLADGVCSALRHIRLMNTQEQKPITNSRDTQELLWHAGCEVLAIFSNFREKTSLLQDWGFHEVGCIKLLFLALLTVRRCKLWRRRVELSTLQILMAHRMDQTCRHLTRTATTPDGLIHRIREDPNRADSSRDSVRPVRRHSVDRMQGSVLSAVGPSRRPRYFEDRAFLSMDNRGKGRTRWQMDLADSGNC
jgi:hypothetical protein